MFCCWQFPIYRLSACINILLWFSQRFITIIIIHIHGGEGKEGGTRDSLIQRGKQNACIVALGLVLPVSHIGHLLFGH